MSALQEIEKELPIKGAVMIKLVASDIDGTLLRDGNTEISKEVFEHIRRLKESGVLFAAARDVYKRQIDIPNDRAAAF